MFTKALRSPLPPLLESETEESGVTRVDEEYDEELAALAVLSISPGIEDETRAKVMDYAEKMLDPQLSNPLQSSEPPSPIAESSAGSRASSTSLESGLSSDTEIVGGSTTENITPFVEAEAPQLEFKPTVQNVDAGLLLFSFPRLPFLMSAAGQHSASSTFLAEESLEKNYCSVLHQAQNENLTQGDFAEPYWSEKRIRVK